MMKVTSKNTGIVLGLALLLLLALTAGPGASAAQAASEDVAMFYDALSPYGTWVDYGNYGPVWYPTQGVTSNWRPYVDGRWVPTSDGWVFETSEPWGWATYHWGNWMPTTEYGWVWNPGSTWYPSTAAWRTSDDYVGWAPIPPPDYVPEPAYYPAGGYYSGMPLLDLISAPFWTFARAANFCPGFGNPFVPAFSYYNCGCLAPFSFVPFVFANTFFLRDFFFPAFNHRAFFFFGPPFPFVSRVTNINIVTINNFAGSTNFTTISNGLPSPAVLQSNPWIGDAIPASVQSGQRLQASRVTDPALVQNQLANPGVVKPPASVPKLTQQIPKGVTPAAQPASVRGGPRGVTAPGGAAAPKVEVAPRGPTAPRGVTAPSAVTAPKGGTAPVVMTAPGRGQRAPTRAPAGETRAPLEAPTGLFKAPGREVPAARESRAPAREFRAPSRGTTLPPSSTHELTPRMQQQMRQLRALSRPAPTPRLSAPAPAPHPSAPAPAPSGGYGHR